MVQEEKQAPHVPGGRNVHMSDELIDRRKTERYPFPANIRFDINGEISASLFRAVTRNVSRAGVCVYLFEKIEKGQEIIISDDHPVIRGKARVQWITELESSFYIAGLKFV